MSKALTGKELKFSRCAVGNGEFDYENESVYELTELKSLKMWLPLQRLINNGNGTVKLEAGLSNAAVEVGFFLKEFGVFATDPDSGAEVLYSYCNVGEECSYLPNNIGPVTKDLKLSFVTIISDAENVTAALDLSVAYILREEYESHVESERPHPNAPCKMDDVAWTNKIWCTDEDTNLHLISIDNLKNILREEKVEVANVKADELGLTANVLMVEDFTDGAVSDYSKVKVTSCAEGGNLLGVSDISEVKIGAIYTISDGVNAEKVQIASALNNNSGYHLKLKNRLDNGYSGNVYLYRTTPETCEKKSLKYESDGFRGVVANQARNLELKYDRGDISGDGILIDGYFSLA